MPAREIIQATLASLDAFIAAPDNVGSRRLEQTRHDELRRSNPPNRDSSIRRVRLVAQVLRNILAQAPKHDEPVSSSVEAFFAHFSTVDIFGYKYNHLPFDGVDDALGRVLLAFHGEFPQYIASRGAIPYVTEYLDQLSVDDSAFHRGSALVPLHPKESHMRDLPQSPMVFTSRIEERGEPSCQRFLDIPTTAEVYSHASSGMILGFDFSNAVLSDGEVRTATDRPFFHSSDLRLGAEIVLGINVLAVLWYYHADAARARIVISHWSTWANARVRGARSHPMTALPWNGSARPLYDVDVDGDIAGCSWSSISRIVSNLQPTKHQMCFAEFYSIMVLRSGFPTRSCDGINLTDLIAVSQIAGQVPNLLYDAISGDHRGAAYFKTARNGKALARRFLAAARWYTQCSPSAIGLTIIPSGLYAYTSKRHSPGYWKYVRPLIVREHPVNPVQRPDCVERFWYGTETAQGFGCPAVQACGHAVRAACASPLTAIIDAVNSITELQTYEEWRGKLDDALIAADGWLCDLAKSPEGGDKMLRATEGAAAPFMDLMTSTLSLSLGL